MLRWIVALAMLLAASGAQAQQSEMRIALIIANEAYVSADLGRLPGTSRDAALMRTALERAGFQVTLRRDLNREQMRRELSAFANRLSQLGQSGVGFLYYAGHGVADGPRGQNYLVPVDAHIAGVPDLPATSIRLNDELDGIALAGARATILVIDACRNTPVALRRGGRGLAPVSAVTDTLVAFSTDAGETATDDGVYARILAEELQRPGADAVTVFARVQARVATETGRAQRPRYDNGLLSEPIVFVRTAATAPPPANPTTRTSTTPQTTGSAVPDHATFCGSLQSEWATLSASTDVAAIDSFVRRTPALCPATIAAAQQRLTSLNAQRTAAPRTGAGTVMWTQRPSAARILSLYPAQARRMGTTGRVELDCRVRSDLTLECTVMSQVPEGNIFHGPALSAAASYRARETLSDGTPAIGARARLSITFRLTE